MSLPTCQVRVVVFDSAGGAPVAGAQVQAQLSSYDVGDGYVVPRLVVGTTDIDGEAFLDLWPNQLGSSESFYTVTITAPNGKRLRTIAVVPNQASADLQDIAELPPYEGRPEAAVYLNTVVQAAQDVTQKAQQVHDDAEATALAVGVATQKATDAGQFASNAEGAANAAAESDASAAGHAAGAATQAGNASAAATVALSTINIKPSIGDGLASVGEEGVFSVLPGGPDNLATTCTFVKRSGAPVLVLNPVSQAQLAGFVEVTEDPDYIMIWRDSSAGRRKFLQVSRSTGALDFVPNAATQAIYAAARLGARKGAAAVAPSGERLLGTARAPAASAHTVSSSTVAPAGLTKSYGYTASPALFTTYGGAPGVYSGGALQMPSSIKPAAGNVTATLSQICARVAVMTDAPSIAFNMKGSSTKWRAFVDGVPASEPQAYASNAGGVYQQITFAGGGSPDGRRVDMEFEQNGGLFAGQSVLVPPGYSIWAVDTTFRRTFVFAGDSFGEGAGSSYSGYAYPYEFGRAIGGMDANIVSCSNGGSGFTIGSSGYPGDDPIRLDHLASFAPSAAIVALGCNDIGVASATLTARALACLQGIRSRLPAVPITVLGTWPGGNGLVASVITTENAVLAAVRQMSDELCQFIPVSTASPPWIDGTGCFNDKRGDGNSDWVKGGTSGNDHVHPRDPGYRFIGPRLARDYVPLLPQFRLL
ncbi:SGNH/GDSL hydrolase family protein [Pseudacidovorax intermedius]|uniref:SGNH/GDSL hydrolase family protein n=1 Tax=Pseudacidovorax intermedius TaxID=433924 RepID=UPI00034BE5A7|nr:SGNH/GDSL hydrolase family protein [Pseudacidovorax intermedius]